MAFSGEPFAQGSDDSGGSTSINALQSRDFTSTSIFFQMKKVRKQRPE
jgi:hypothetical protein